MYEALLNSPSDFLKRLTIYRRLHDDSLLRNSLFLMATTIFSSLLGYFYWVIAAHTYTASEVGLASAIISVMTLTSLLSNLGFGSALVQILPRREHGHDWSALLNFSLIASSLTSLLGGLIAVILLLRSPQFAEMTQNYVYVGAFLASVPLWTASMLVDSTFTAERATSNMMTRNLIFSIMKIMLLVLFSAMNIQGLGIFLSWILSAFVALIASFILIRRLGRGYLLSFRGWKTHSRTLLSALIGNYFINLGGALPLYLLPVFVTARLSAADNAYFYATWMLGSQFSLISVAVAASLFAEGSYTTANISAKIRRSVAITTVLLLPSMALVFVFGYRILGIFGPVYPERGTPLLMLLTFAAIFDAITSIYVSVLRVQNRLRAATVLNTLMAVLTISLSWIFLPTLGITGTGCAWLIAQGTGTLITITDYLLTRRNIVQMETGPELSDGIESAVTETVASSS